MFNKTPKNETNSLSPIKDLKLPELAKTSDSKQRKDYSIFKEPIVQLLKQKPLPPWKRLDGIKPSGYEGKGPHFTDFWSTREKLIAMKMLNPNSVKSKVAKVFYQSEKLRRKKSFDQKFLKRLPMLAEEDFNLERCTFSPIKSKSTKNVIKLTSDFI
ncbi:unnamed protein product [Blepharisma stoltei]|uniref:Uncharacterized protein n=1 Tax=Blepharisma stoltei TaxID=1481888 RepID=A0AAU9K9P2_9CILI|nr:unnamed protein product [Blepharisma stoltei]